LRQVDVYEPMVQREAEALVSAGFDVEVICMRSTERPRHVVVNGVSVTSLPVARKKAGKARYAFDYGRFFLLAAGLVALRHMRRRYAVVQVNTMPDFLVFAAFVPKVTGSRVVAYMHEPSPELAETLFGPGPLVSVLKRVEQLVLRFADHTITVTEQLKQRYVERGARAECITVVLNGVDPATVGAASVQRPLREGHGFTLVCHGSIEERYGQDTVIEAARVLKGEMPDLRVVITGRGSRADELSRTIASAGVQDVVRFEGWVGRARLNEILLTADAGVVAQKASPYSHLVHTNKMVDYWMFGLPVIASRLRAVSETYDDTVIEYFEPGDADGLAAAVRHLRADPARRADLAAMGREAEAQMGWRVQRMSYLRVFDALAPPGERQGDGRPGAARPRPVVQNRSA
jgi:glycosyltransferase involved in cell wall biosynthesis